MPSSFITTKLAQSVDPHVAQTVVVEMFARSAMPVSQHNPFNGSSLSPSPPPDGDSVRIDNELHLLVLAQIQLL